MGCKFLEIYEHLMALKCEQREQLNEITAVGLVECHSNV